ncbi:MAG: hypothetical protein ACJATM_001313 [Alphaproteobacteria bacterium]|jgi:hypothetical protein
MNFKSLIIENKEFNYNLDDGKLYSYKKKLNKYTQLFIYKNKTNVIPRLYVNKKRIYLHRIIYKIFNQDWDLFDNYNYVNIINGIKNVNNCNIENLELLPNVNLFNKESDISEEPCIKQRKTQPKINKPRSNLMKIIGYNPSKIDVRNKVILNF